MTLRLVVVAVMSVHLTATSPSKVVAADVDHEIGWAENLCLAKGGIGIVRTDLHVVVASDRNELRLAGDARWTGREAAAREVVYVFEGKVVEASRLPARFDLAKAVVISFEGPIVRFLDFETMKGGLYRRPADR